MVLKKTLLLVIIFLFLACKSTQNNTNNQLDITEVTSKTTENNIQLSELTLNEFELDFKVADPKKPVIITDKNGNQQKLENVSSGTLKKKSAIKKDSTAQENKTVAEKKSDNSKINETAKTVSDAKNFKGIFGYAALIVICLTIVFLIIRFKIKAIN